jgi:hypothetical protein
VFEKELYIEINVDICDDGKRVVSFRAVTAASATAGIFDELLLTIFEIKLEITGVTFEGVGLTGILSDILVFIVFVFIVVSDSPDRSEIKDVILAHVSEFANILIGVK